MATSDPAPSGSAARTADARPIAALRITLSAVAMLALLDVVPNLGEWLSDDGVMPRAAFLDGSARAERFCLLDSVGRPWQVALYLTATYAALAALFVGYRTRLASIASFVLVAGVYERNFYLFDGADTVIRVLLFWLIFADAGAAHSVDARQRGTNDAEARVPLVPTRLIELQIAWVYLATAVIKLGHPLWRDGTAVHYALSTPHVFTRSVATTFRDDVAFVRAATYGTLVFELAFPLLVLGLRRFPRARLAAIVGGIAFHLGTFLMLDIGAFPLVMCASYVVFCEASWLERALARFDARITTVLATRLPRPPRGEHVGASPAMARARDGALVLLFALAAWNGFHATDLPGMRTTPRALAAIPQALSLWQRWDMFAPDPIRSDYQLEVRGVRLDSVQVDALADAPGGAILEPGRGVFYDRWTKFLSSVAFGRRAVRLPFARYVCRRWNDGRADDERLASLRIVRIERTIAPLGRPANEARAVEIFTHACHLGAR